MLTLGNRKLPKTTAIFNLPAVKTCPNSTEQCRKWCYARKAERMYPQVLPFRMNNLKNSKQVSFITKLALELRAKKKVNTVRIHESGDFYNQLYFNKWCQIAKHFPDIVFYAYTKNITINVSHRPKNFILLLSDDNEEFKKEWKLYNGVAKVTLDKDFSKKGWFICPGNCKECNYCYAQIKKQKKVVFKVH